MGERKGQGCGGKASGRRGQPEPKGDDGKEERVLQEETSKDKDGDHPGAFWVLGIAPRAPVVGREGGGRHWEAHGALCTS